MSHEPRIQEILRHVRGPTVLDLGAVQHDIANAQSDEWLHDRIRQLPGVERLVGVDRLESDVAELNQRGYEMVAANVETMDLNINADTVVAGELLEHVENPGLMLTRVVEHMADGGRFVLSTPNPWAVVHLRRWLHRSPQINGEHVAWYGPVVLKQLLARHGLAVTEMNAVGPDNTGLTRLAKRLGYDIFGGNTWVAVAERGES